MNLKSGLLVTVYHDPITRADREGVAKLVTSRKSGNDNLSIWLVEFVNEPNEYYQRTINKRDVLNV